MYTSKHETLNTLSFTVERVDNGFILYTMVTFPSTPEDREETPCVTARTVHTTPSNVHQHIKTVSQRWCGEAQVAFQKDEHDV